MVRVSSLYSSWYCSGERSQRGQFSIVAITQSVPLESAPAQAGRSRERRRPFPATLSFPMPDVDWIRKLCLSFPDVTEDMPWGDDLCFKVRGKIFTGMVLSDGRFPRITLKCAPETFHDLLEIEGASP